MLLSSTTSKDRHAKDTQKQGLLPQALSPNAATRYSTLGWVPRESPAPLIQPLKHGHLKPQVPPPSLGLSFFTLKPK